MDYTEADIRDLRASGHWPPADDTETAQETPQDATGDAGKGKGKTDTAPETGA